ncbi:Peptide hydrolase [Mycena sanguinolenta]|uniref:Peptide hydrolase n=1 Tax=Mycena sanguinolenta TaxID=230812 RepID=A0A8H7DCF2_9AGAR|nr:Peptide hydrolase [Mycena sanguinolenta]
MNASLKGEHDLQRASLPVKPGQKHPSNSLKGLDTSFRTSTKRPPDDSSEEQKRKKQKLAENKRHNDAVAETLRNFTMIRMKNQMNSQEKPKMKYENGALRLTRTPGRRHAPNTVSLADLIHPDFLCSAIVYAFFIENDHVFQFFPFENGRNPQPHVQVYVGRDLSMDSVGKDYAGCTKKSPKGDEFDRVVECAQDGYRNTYGTNFHAFYAAMKSGCAHSKIMVLVYPDFLRVVITSANLMQTDVVLGDNSWFIQVRISECRFPRLTEETRYKQKPWDKTFGWHLRRHVEELGCPHEFLDMYLEPDVFDFSAAKGHLVTSRPGSWSGTDANEYGQLRLRHVVRRKVLKDYSDTNPLPRMAFEICVGSIGHLETEGVVKNFLESCAGNLQKSIEGKPALKMIFPTSSQVNLLMPGAGNISSHMDWKSLEEDHFVKSLFHHYYSKDPGCLFHLKTILVLRADAPKRTPLYMYIGSANFSTNAWGAVMPELRDRVIADTLTTERIERIANYECGVVIKGKDIAGMLETGKWEDIVPYERPTEVNVRSLLLRSVSFFADAFFEMQRYRKGERPWRVPKSAFQAPMDQDSDSDNEEDEAEMEQLVGPRSVIHLVRLLSGAKVLKLRGKAE